MKRQLSDPGINYIDYKEQMPPKDGTIILAFNKSQHRYDDNYFIGKVRFIKGAWVDFSIGGNVRFTHWAPINPPVGCKMDF